MVVLRQCLFGNNTLFIAEFGFERANLFYETLCTAHHSDLE